MPVDFEKTCDLAHKTRRPCDFCFVVPVIPGCAAGADPES
jgi:hypothetical protein